METKTAWSGFAGRKWKEDVDVRDFIQKNYEPYRWPIRGTEPRCAAYFQKPMGLKEENSEKKSALQAVL